MKKYIFCNYYRDPNPDRAREYLTCVNHNLSLSWVDAVYIYVENHEHVDDITHVKARFQQLDRRMEFGDVIKQAQSLEPNSLIVIVNLDIYLADSAAWQNIKSEFFDIGHTDKAMVCTRINVDADGSTWIEGANWKKGDFCDVWVLRTPLNEDFVKEDMDFCVGGAPQCDNTMMYLMSKYYHVYSWGAKYHAFHLDLCRKQDVGSGMITNSATDWRPSRRIWQHIDITAYQDWDRLLIEQRQPEYRSTWLLPIV
jgi:hypothetical protein